MTDAPTQTGGEFLSREEASAYLQSRFHAGSRQYLARLAVTGGGPRHYKFCRRVLYRREDLDQWASERMGEARTSTSDDDGATRKAPASKGETSKHDRPKGRTSSRPSSRGKTRQSRRSV